MHDWFLNLSNSEIEIIECSMIAVEILSGLIVVTIKLAGYSIIYGCYLPSIDNPINNTLENMKCMIYENSHKHRLHKLNRIY